MSKSARQSLSAAIKLHQAHMDGSAPTSESSQERLMDLMMAALDALDADSAAAKRSLSAAIALHEKHMDGSAPTSAASQQKMMDLMMAALDALPEMKSMAVKFVKGSRDLIEGLAIPFGSMGRKDLDGEFFTKDTDLCLEWFNERPLLYHHGLHDTIKATVVGRVKSYDIRDDGVWVQAEIDKNSRYRQHVSKLIDEAAVGFSSGAMQHLVETDTKTGRITRWPWVEESLTPTPASPDALQVYAVKSTDLIEHLAAIETPIPAALIASALKSMDTNDGSEHGPFTAHGQRVLADVRDFVDRIGARKDARTKADRTLSENDRSVLLDLQGLLWTISADVDAMIRATDPQAQGRAAEALGLMAEFEAIQARLAGVPV